MLSVYLNDTTYRFPISIGEEEQQLITIHPRQWQPGDGASPWRIPLHNWQDGLGPDRFRGRNTYAKANADVSNDGILVPPPLLNSLTLASYTLTHTAIQLRYAGAAYGTVPYVGEISGRRFEFFIPIGENDYLAGGHYVWKLAPDRTLTLSKDFGSTSKIYDMKRFLGKLYVAMGPTEPIWEYNPTTDTWTQATEAVYAIALGQIDNKLYRGESINRLSNCIVSPLSLASWVPSSPNQYIVGDDTYPIKQIVDYGGVPWVKKRDGVYAPDAKAEFHNQSPQLAQWPQDCDHKDMWVAWGALFTWSPAGLLRVLPGESVPVGPELSGRPAFRFHITGGIEFGKDQYLLAYDSASIEQSAVFTMTRHGDGYKYDELIRLGQVASTGGIAISTAPSLPEVRAGIDLSVKYFSRGRGGGRPIDDPSYPFNLTWELETGKFAPLDDLSMLATLVGIHIVADIDNSEELYVEAAVDSGTYQRLKYNQEAGGQEIISATDGYASINMLAPHSFKGQFFECKLSGILDSSIGTDRPEVREVYAWGYVHPRMTDQVSCILSADRVSIVNPNQQQSEYSPLELWSTWKNNGEILDIEIPTYGRHKFNISSIDEIEVLELAEGSRRKVSRLQIELARVDYGNRFSQ